MVKLIPKTTCSVLEDISLDLGVKYFEPKLVDPRIALEDLTFDREAFGLLLESERSSFSKIAVSLLRVSS